ncbi:ScyD/ScyE family protein [Phytoactinopolyspora halotolerans]|uniref:ScyD/ScyE family protein n=1 Tax=Phytoactinopolyspora halotolerans TaxID=1981512 RepID=A0A6L9S5N6_9ACTN|nr:ScyD/ScyE family protein [Phytoactinopolyspora halotolerans]NED99807.1 ScyD/ScyE family protein [Phytoactinopolyspora halotolerans]
MALASAVVLVAGGTQAAADDGLVTVVDGLDGPRGVATGPAGRVVFAEADGSISELTTKGRHAGSVADLGAVPATFIAPAVAMHGRGNTFALTAAGAPGSGAATLYKSNPGQGVRAVADIAAYQEIDPDPYDVEDHPEESNPFGVAALPDGSALVADAAGNDLLRVFPDGEIVTVARNKPRVVETPEGLPDEFEGEPLPPAGTPIPSEGVATSVTVGPDGYYYVGELRGFPGTPGTSQIWRIAPDSVDAVCDPDAPDTGACQRHADGFTSIVDLDFGPDGSLYVVELVAEGWFPWELGLVPPIGALHRVSPDGGTTVELAAGELILPGGVAVDHKGTVYVTGPVFGPGELARVQ